MADKRRVAVVSSIPPRDDWKALAEITWGALARYCERHGYDFFPDVSDVWAKVRSPYIGDANQGYEASIRHSVKFRLFQQYLSGNRYREPYDFVVWADADCLFTNHDIPLEKFFNEHGASSGRGPFLGDVILAHDINGYHPTVVMVRSSSLTRDMVWAMANMGLTMFQQHDWDDIMCWRFWAATPPYNGMVWTHSAKILCALPPEIDYGHPKDGEDYTWDSDSLSLHLSALNMDARIELAGKYARELKLL